MAYSWGSRPAGGQHGSWQDELLSWQEIWGTRFPPLQKIDEEEERRCRTISRKLHPYCLHILWAYSWSEESFNEQVLLLVLFLNQVPKLAEGRAAVLMYHWRFWIGVRLLSHLKVPAVRYSRGGVDSLFHSAVVHRLPFLTQHICNKISVTNSRFRLLCCCKSWVKLCWQVIRSSCWYLIAVCHLAGRCH